MDLDALKKLSEIFNNFAQPIATIIASCMTVKILVEKSKSTKNKKHKK